MTDPPADLLPDPGRDQHRPEQVGIGQQQRRGLIDQPEEVAHDAALRREYLDQYAGQDDPGEEVRQVAHRLHDALELLVGELVDQERQDDRSRKPEGDPQEADDDGVAEDPPEEGVAEQDLEVMEVVPLAPQEAQVEAIVLERGDDPVDRQIVEHEQERESGEQCKVQEPHPLGSAPSFAPPERGSLQGGARGLCGGEPHLWDGSMRRYWRRGAAVAPLPFEMGRAGRTIAQ